MGPMREVAKRASAAGFGLAIAGTLAFGWAFQRMPPSHGSRWGISVLGARHLAESAGIVLEPLSPDAFYLSARSALALAWAGYAVGILLGWRTGRIGIGSPRALVVGALAATAVLFPLALSCDAYAYAGYARMALRYGLNPHVHSQFELVERGDPTGPFLRWDVASPYGPLWTLLSIAIVAPLQAFPLAVQVFAFKLLGGAAVLVAAGAARDLADQLAPGRGELAFVSVGLCPLFLVEGAGSGHNDVVMMALLLLAARQMLRGRAGSGELLLGTSIAVKFATLPVAAFSALGALRRSPKGERWAAFFRAVLLGVGPTLLCALPFMAGAEIGTGLVEHFRSRATALPGSAAEDLWPIGVVFVLGAAWSLMRREAAAWHVPWIGLSTAMAVLATGIPFPWYTTWPCALALARWGRRDVWVSGACLSLAAFLMWSYTIPAGAGP